ncbi:hypothetical protein [Plantactinospora veratri]
MIGPAPLIRVTPYGGAASAGHPDDGSGQEFAWVKVDLEGLAGPEPLAADRLGGIAMATSSTQSTLPT